VRWRTDSSSPAKYAEVIVLEDYEEKVIARTSLARSLP
jgi:hypothetical protein